MTNIRDNNYPSTEEHKELVLSLSYKTRSEIDKRSITTQFEMIKSLIIYFTIDEDLRNGRSSEDIWDDLEGFINKYPIDGEKQ